MVCKGLIRKLKIEQQEQNFSDINNGLQSTNQKCKTEQQEERFSEINNGLQRTNQKTSDWATGAKIFTDK
jgi:hypothetical protein